MNHTNFMIADYNLNVNSEEDNEKIRMLTRNSKLSTEIHGEKQNMPSPLVMSEPNKKDTFLSFCFRNIYSDHPTVGFRYCDGGVLSDEYVSLQIRKQAFKNIKGNGVGVGGARGVEGVGGAPLAL